MRFLFLLPSIFSGCASSTIMGLLPLFLAFFALICFYEGLQPIFGSSVSGFDLSPFYDLVFQC